MPDGATRKVVFRTGSATDDALTPRPKDLEERPGVKPGLSVNIARPVGTKFQKIAVDVLQGCGLSFIPDDVSAGGEVYHGVIAPTTSSGDIDYQKLNEWASFRGGGIRHKLTQAVLDAIIK